jgi:hypothetical protein
MRFSLFSNLLGTALLFFSFQATSSNLKIVTTSDYARTAVCVNGRGLIVSNPNGTEELGGACPEWEHARAAAVVNIERPDLLTIGIILILTGFLGQYLSVPNAKTIEQLRAELKTERRLAKAQAKHPPTQH